MLLLSNQGMLNGLTTSENKSIKGMRIQLDHGSMSVKMAGKLQLPQLLKSYQY